MILKFDLIRNCKYKKLSSIEILNNKRDSKKNIIYYSWIMRVNHVIFTMISILIKKKGNYVFVQLHLEKARGAIVPRSKERDTSHTTVVGNSSKSHEASLEDMWPCHYATQSHTEKACES